MRIIHFWPALAGLMVTVGLIPITSWVGRRLAKVWHLKKSCHFETLGIIVAVVASARSTVSTLPGWRTAAVHSSVAPEQLHLFLRKTQPESEPETCRCILLLHTCQSVRCLHRCGGS